MKPNPDITEVILRFLTPREEPFTPTAQSYVAEMEDSRAPRRIQVPWDDAAFQRDLLALAHRDCDDAVLARFGETLRSILARADWALQERRIAEAIKAGSPVQIVISSMAPELYDLPWELLPIGREGRFLSMCPKCLIRYERPGNPEPRNKLVGRLLLAYSTLGVPPWLVEAHIKALESACARGALDFNRKRDVLVGVTRERLAKKLEEQDPPVTALHLLCHGTRETRERYGLVFNPVREDGDRDVVSSMDLRDLLVPTHALRLATICACYSGDSSAPSNPIPGIAQMLHLQEIPAVIAARWPLSFDGSVTLAETLYGHLLGEGGDLASALAEVRMRLVRAGLRNDFVSLQMYAQKGPSVLLPFTPGEARVTTAPGEVVLLRHEAYSKANMEVDAPELIAGRTVRMVTIDQTALLEKPERTKQAWVSAAQELADPDGPFQRELARPGTELVYYGFPLVPLGVLAGYLTKASRAVHVFEPDHERKRFRWAGNSDEPYPKLKMISQRVDAGSAARVRVSMSSPVELDDCRVVLPEQDVRLDVHFHLDEPRKLIIRQERQVREYAAMIRDVLEQYVASDRNVQSIHLFAAVPVSLSFLIGQALSSTALPRCYVYNYARSDTPHYKWRVSLRDAAARRPAVALFKGRA